MECNHYTGRNSRLTAPVCGCFFMGENVKYILIVTILLLLPMTLMAKPVKNFALDEPDTAFVSNSVIDIIVHDEALWMATSEGVNFSFDGGDTWLLYNTDNGLPANQVSALFSLNNRLWLGVGHTKLVNEYSISFSDALTFTDDNGRNWLEADFGDIPNVLGGQRTIYDITGHFDDESGDEWIFYTGWAGGFLGSQDGGMTWRRIVPTPGDTIYYQTGPREIDLYFSCAADTTHGDSLFLWTGTAGGLFQYAFAPPTEKPQSKIVTSFAFCDDCSGADTSWVFIGGNNGITRGKKTGGPFISRFVSDGLPGPYISALYAFGGRVFAGTMDSADGLSTGLAYSDDAGDSYSQVLFFDDVIGEGRKISELIQMRDRLYLVAETAGLFVSSDTGLTWSHIFVDSSDISPTNGRNVVHALNVLEDTLRVGTDSGLVTLYMDEFGEIQSSWYDVFPEKPDFGSTRVIKVKTQVFNTDLAFDSLAIWALTRPVTDTGSPVVFRSYDISLQVSDIDTLWAPLQVNVNSNDVAFLGDSVFVIGESGVRYSLNGSNPSNIVHVVDSLNRIWLDDDILTFMAVDGDTVFMGSENGFAISNDRVQKYKVYRISEDTLKADFVRQYTYNNTIGELPGNFIPAMGLQEIPDENYARIWVSGRPASSEENIGITMGKYFPFDSSGEVIESDTLPEFAGYGLVWNEKLEDNFAWNYAFNGDTVFGASSDGLLMSFDDDYNDWDTIPLEDINGVPFVDSIFSVYAVEVFDDYLFVGTGQATLRMPLSGMYVDKSFFYVDSLTPLDDVYAFPIPVSQSSARGVDFHFELNNDENVTLEVYDPAMNLVRRIIDNESYSQGVYHGRNSGLPFWDGRNGKGDKVAVGIYYFKVETSGDVRWGRLAVLP